MTELKNTKPATKKASKSTKLTVTELAQKTSLKLSLDAIKNSIDNTELVKFETNWKTDVLATNKEYKDTSKSIGGSRAFLLAMDSLNPNFRKLLILSKNPAFYSILASKVKVNAKSGKTSPFYLLSTLKAEKDFLVTEFNKVIAALEAQTK